MGWTRIFGLMAVIAWAVSWALERERVARIRESGLYCAIARTCEFEESVYLFGNV